MNGYQVKGKNPLALFTLKLHRGDGMTLLAMNWKVGPPPRDFVGFAIEYKEPRGDRFYALKKPHRVSGRGRRRKRADAVNPPIAHPEISLGSFSAQRRAQG